jgi:acetyltransferase-like isoleucine patch superfamily enzyme
MKRLFLFLLLPCPSFLKVILYRYMLGYRIGRSVRIGFSIVSGDDVQIGDGARIGHLNYIARMKQLKVGREAAIGHLNIILGGDLVEIGDEAIIGRLNEINSIINPLNSGPSDPRLIIGRAAVITAWHKIDFTDRVNIGDSAIIAGRSSCIWTHNRQQVAPVDVGRNCYVGSGVQFVPGASVGPYCVVGLGSVITKSFVDEYRLVAGVPARDIKPLDEAGRVLVEFTTRPDLG